MAKGRVWLMAVWFMAVWFMANEYENGARVKNDNKRSERHLCDEGPMKLSFTEDSGRDDQAGSQGQSIGHRKPEVW
ncbi:hypothetical protein AVEN_62858-1 [Araneus ventricosus]|uniref:Uncharacterized protein n=1 Tax=Araneus ventricosus TaxID=182803 RepID=A0A4Y2QUC1_ARAVE|nr:hypothetical protein AVEN_62858-1 [Araneus ventricosus]